MTRLGVNTMDDMTQEVFDRLQCEWILKDNMQVGPYEKFIISTQGSN